MGKKRTKPKRLFRQRRIPAAVVQAIDKLADGNLELRAVLDEAVAVIDSHAFWDVFRSVPPHQRAVILLSLRDSAFALRDSKPCDFCEAEAQRIRFTVIAPGEDLGGVKRPEESASLVGCTVLCDRCFGMAESKHKRRTLDVYGKVQPLLGDNPYRRHVILGSRIGEAGSLPSRHSLEECGDCEVMLWIDQDGVDQISRETPAFLCLACAQKRLEAGTMDCVPTSLTGVLP